MPMAVPSTKAQSTGVMPMKSDKRAPMISRVSMSRPSSSLPSGKPAVPIGLSRWSIDDWYGSAGASHAARDGVAAQAQPDAGPVAALAPGRQGRGGASSGRAGGHGVHDGHGLA